VKRVAAAALACTLARAAAAPYTLDPTHTTVHFDVEVAGGLATQRGRFDRKRGSVEFDPGARSGRAEIVIDTASVTTGAAALDAALRTLLDTTQAPEARWIGERFVFDGDRVVEVAGTLTLRGRSAPLTLKATRFGCYRNPLFGRQVCGGDFEATLSLAAAGLVAAGVGDRVRLLVQVEAIAP